MMEKVLVFQEKEVPAKGLRKNGLRKNFPDEEKIKEFMFTEDYKRLAALPQQRISLPETPVLFYPGCGTDILFPLLFMEKFFPKLERCTFIFADKEFTLGLIKTVLDEVGIYFSENNYQTILFYWKNMLIELQFIRGDVFSLFPQLPDFNIYFEKAFGIFKHENSSYEKNIFEKLKPEGVLISDSGFQWLSLKNLQRISVPKGLSSYGEMVVGVKKDF